MASVLVIDDDEMVRTMLLRTLARGGYEATGARDWRGEVARSREAPCDL